MRFAYIYRSLVDEVLTDAPLYVLKYWASNVHLGGHIRILDRQTDANTDIKWILDSYFAKLLCSEIAKR
jgi:hypothetical protein